LPRKRVRSRSTADTTGGSGIAYLKRMIARDQRRRGDAYGDEHPQQADDSDVKNSQLVIRAGPGRDRPAETGDERRRADGRRARHASRRRASASMYARMASSRVRLSMHGMQAHRSPLGLSVVVGGTAAGAAVVANALEYRS
jgi:hypothetical protein